MENFCRIYPSRNSKLYDKYFSIHKPLNKILYKVFYTNDILPYIRHAEKSAHPVPSKANSLMAQNAIKQGVSQDRLHSATGTRPIRSSKSNQKLSQQHSVTEDSKQSVRTGSQSPTEKRDRFIEQ